MVGTHDLVVDLSVNDEVHGGWRGVDIVNTPADIASADVAALTPPGVTFFDVATDGAEGVDPTLIEPSIELFALFGAKTTGGFVGFRSREVDGTVGGVEVAHDQDAGSAGEFAGEHLTQVGVEVELVGDAAEVAVFTAPVGEVDVEDLEFPDFCDLHSAFDVEGLHVNGIGDGVEGGAAVDANTAVAFSFCGVEVGVPALGLARGHGELFGESADFLESDDVGLAGLEPVEKALAHTGAESVDVPAVDLQDQLLDTKHEKFKAIAGPGGSPQVGECRCIGGAVRTSNRGRPGCAVNAGRATPGGVED